MKKSLIILALFSVMVFSVPSKVVAQEFNDYSETDSSFENKTSKRISPEIIYDLKEFFALLPIDEFNSIIKENLKNDGDFREGYNFLNSSNFTDMWKKLITVKEIDDLLESLNLFVPDLTESDLSVPYLEIVLLEAMEAEKQHKIRRRRSIIISELKEFNEDFNLRSFTSVARKIVDLLPVGKYRGLVQEKCANSNLFKNAFKNLCGNQFRQNVTKAMDSKNLEPYISTLYSNSIDIKELIEIAFKNVKLACYICT